MLRRLASITAAYLLTLCIIATIFALFEAFAPGRPTFDRNAFTASAEIGAIVYGFALFTTIIPFAIIRFVSGRLGALTLPAATICGACLGPIALFLMSLFGAGISGEPIVFVAFAALGGVCGLAYGWIELRISGALGIPQTLQHGA
jgi:hypothetical protein